MLFRTSNADFEMTAGSVNQAVLKATIIQVIQPAMPHGTGVEILRNSKVKETTSVMTILTAKTTVISTATAILGSQTLWRCVLVIKVDAADCLWWLQELCPAIDDQPNHVNCDAASTD